MEKTDKKTIVMGITGSVAACKCAELCSRFTKEGYDVNVIMTASAQKLVCPRTFLTLSQNPVMTDLWEIPDWRPGHIDLSERADLLLIAPATANIIAKIACGIADDALSTYVLSHQGPIVIAPAMNPKMWSNVAVQENVDKLKKRGITFVGPGTGPVACGPPGTGRLEDIDKIYSEVISLLT